MKDLNVGEFKTHFSEVLKDVKHGERVIISFGKKKEKLAVIIPYRGYAQTDRHLGILTKRGSFKILEGFKFSDKDFFNS